MRKNEKERGCVKNVSTGVSAWRLESGKRCGRGQNDKQGIQIFITKTGRVNLQGTVERVAPEAG